jgi:hypothetical protein
MRTGDGVSYTIAQFTETPEIVSLKDKLLRISCFRKKREHSSRWMDGQERLARWLLQDV